MLLGPLVPEAEDIEPPSKRYQKENYYPSFKKIVPSSTDKDSQGDDCDLINNHLPPFLV